jgi:hypothetical protein
MTKTSPLRGGGIAHGDGELLAVFVVAVELMRSFSPSIQYANGDFSPAIVTC